MRKLWISDIHGHFKPMIELLREANYKPGEDLLIVGGDMVDRGPDSGPVLRYIHDLTIAHPTMVQVMKGNHEEMLGMWLAGKLEWKDFKQYGEPTVDSFNNDLEEEEFDTLMKWMLELPVCFQDKEYFYVHAGINPFLPFHLQRPDDFLWIRDEFFEASSEIILNITNGRTVVHGHTPASYVVNDGARINCDLGAASNSGLGLIDLTNQVYYLNRFWKKDIVKRDILLEEPSPI